jgi:hypothetical protein
MLLWALRRGCIGESGLWLVKTRRYGVTQPRLWVVTPDTGMTGPMYSWEASWGEETLQW